MSHTNHTPTTPTFAQPTHVKLSKAELLKDKEDGLTVPEQATKYGIPPVQMRKALKIAGITTKAKRKSKYQFDITE